MRSNQMLPKPLWIPAFLKSRISKELPSQRGNASDDARQKGAGSPGMVENILEQLQAKPSCSQWGTLAASPS